MILELAQDAEGCGIRLQQYVTDLDAKTAAAVRHAAAEAGIDLPEQMYDPGHHEHNERVKATNGTGAPAGKKRRVSTCTYCGGREQPAHLSRRTCPKRLREEAAHAGAGPAGSV